MKNSNYIVIYIFMVISAIVNIFIIPTYFQDFAKLANLGIWIILFIMALPIKNEHARFKGNKDKIKTVVIIVILYYIVYSLLGLIFQYKQSPYSHDLISIFKNIMFIFLVGLLQEYTRSKLVNSTTKMWKYVFITIIFVILKLNYYNFLSNFINAEHAFKYVSSVVFMEFISSCLLTYLSLIRWILIKLCIYNTNKLSNIVIACFSRFRLVFKYIS